MTDVFCSDEGDRRADLLGVDLNAIDYLEVDEADRRLLHVYFLKPVPVAAYGLVADPSRIAVSGGTRIVGIRVLGATRVGPNELRVEVDRSGDFSPYELALEGVPEVDPRSARVTFSFMASCPVDVDCRRVEECPEPLREEPLLDYLAKDYASFRRLLLDLAPRLDPDFVERSPADLGIALVELLAWAGDNLSYFQDAVANEAFLDTVRRRISARRHARLVDYRMHDGRNAWAAVHVAVDAPGPLPQGTLLLSRIARPLRHATAPPQVVVDLAAVGVDAFASDPALAGVAAFETAHPVDLAPELNEVRVHTWGNAECCLPVGTREAYLYSVDGGIAVAPPLAAGDRLLLEEVLGPVTGLAADADPAHRAVVLLEEVEATTDPLYADTLAGDELAVRQAAQAPLPLLRVRWRRADALAFPLCLSARLPDGRLVERVSVARGNVVLADHGLTVDELVPVAAETRLPRGPLTLECRPDGARYDPATGRLATERRELACDVREAQPAVALLAGGDLWEPVPDLLDSTPFAQEFVAEVDDDGRALLRFGDGEYGRPLGDDVEELRAVYRIGNGRAGNVGAEAIAHVALVGPAAWIRRVRNPLAARGGTDPESIEEVRRRAPQAFRARQLRAVTEADYAAAARELPEVAGAVATFRWTGSWWTVFVGVDPADPDDLVNEPDGFTRLSPGLEQRVRAFLTRFRLAGYDLELRPPRFVPLELDLEVCAQPGYFRTDVAAAVERALSPRRGFFDPANFTFGDPVYLSRLYAAVERVEGVDSVTITTFRRYGQADNGELAAGVLTTGPWEIARLDDDPSFVEHGVLHVTGTGGKA